MSLCLFSILDLTLGKGRSEYSHLHMIELINSVRSRSPFLLSALLFVGLVVDGKGSESDITSGCTSLLTLQLPQAMNSSICVLTSCPWVCTFCCFCTLQGTDGVFSRHRGTGSFQSCSHPRRRDPSAS